MSDGSLKFDTSLDTSGFDRDSLRLRQEILRLVQTINGMGQEVKSALGQGIPEAEKLTEMAGLFGEGFKTVDLGSFEDYLRDARKQLTDLVKEANRSGEKLAQGLTRPAEIRKANADIDHMKRSLGALAAILRQVGQAHVISPEFTEKIREIEALKGRIQEVRDEIEELKKKPFEGYTVVSRQDTLKDLTQDLAELQAERDKMAASGSFQGQDNAQYQALMETVTAVTQMLQTMQEKVNGTAESTDKAGQAMQAAGEAVREAAGALEETAPMQAGAALEETTQALEEAGAAAGETAEQVSQTAEAIDEIDASAEAAAEDIQDAGQSLQNLSGQANGAAQAADQAGAAVGQVNSAVTGIGSSAANLARSGAQAAQAMTQMGQAAGMSQGLSNLTSALDGCVDLIRSAASGLAHAALSLGEAARGGITVLAQTLGRAARGLRQVGAAVKGAALNTLQMGAHTAAAAVRGLCLAVRDLTRASLGMVRSGIGALGKSLSGLGRRLQGFRAESSKAGGGLLGLIRPTLTLVGLFQLLRKGVRGWTRDFSAAFAQLKKVNPQLRSLIAGLEGTARAASGNLAVMAGSFVRNIGPAVEQVIAWILTMLTYLNSFLAMLSGKKTILVAADNTKNLGKSAGSSAKKVEELKRQIYGFDELNRRDSDKTGGGAGSGGVEYVEKQIDSLLPETIRGYFKAMEEAIKAQKWEQVGQLIAQGLNAGLAAIERTLETWQERLITWSRNLARTMNGIVGAFDWGPLGRLVANGLNTIAGVQSEFLRTFSFDALGTGLAQAFDGLVSAVNWKGIGELFYLKISAFITTVHAFLSAAHFRSLGDGLREAFTRLVEQVPWAHIGETFGKMIDAFLDTLSGFLSPQALEKLGTGLAQGFNSLVYKVNWLGLAASFGQCIQALRAAFEAFIVHADFEALASRVALTLSGMFTEAEFVKLAETARLGIQKVAEAVSSFDKQMDWSGNAVRFSAGVNRIFDSQVWTDVARAIARTINGIGAGLAAAVGAIQWERIREAFVKGINTMIDVAHIHEQIRLAAQTIGYITVNFLGSVAGIKWTLVGRALAKGVNSVFEMIPWKDIAKEFGDAMVSVLNGMEEAITGLDWDGNREKFVDGINKMIDVAEIERQIQLAATALSHITVQFMGAVANIKWNLIAKALAKGITSAFEAIDWTSIAKNFGICVRTVFESISLFLDEVDWNRVGLEIGAAIGQIDWTGIAGSMWAAFKDALKASFNLVEGVAEAIAESAGMEQGWTIGLGSSDWTHAFDANAFGSGLFLRDIQNQFKLAGGDLARSMFDAFRDEVPKGTQLTQAQLTQAAYLIVNGYSLEMKKQNPKVYAAAVDLIRGAYDVNSAAELQDRWRTLGFDVSEAFAREIGTAGYQNVAMALMLLGHGVNEETIKALDLSNLDANLKTYMAETGQRIDEVAVALANDTGNTIGLIVPQAMADSLETGKAVVQAEADDYANIAANLENRTQIKTKAEESGKQAIAGTQEGLTQTKPVEQEAKVVTQKIEDPFHDLPEATKAQAQLMMQAIEAAISEGTPQAEQSTKSAAEAVLQKAREILNGESGKGISQEFMNGIVQGITGCESAILTAVQTVCGKVTSTMQNALSGQKGRDLGRNFVQSIASGMGESASSGVFTNACQSIVSSAANTIRWMSGSWTVKQMGYYIALGIADGISDNVGYITNAAYNAASRAVNAAKRFLGIRSPSRVFAELGMYSMLGLAQGIDENGNEAVEAVGRAVSSMEKAGEGEIDLHVNRPLEALDQMAARMEQVASIFERITDMIADLGGLPIPEIATGTVVPYRTALVPEEHEADHSQMVRGQADQTEVLEDQRDLIRELISVVRGLNLSLDTDQLSRAVSGRQRDLDRSYVGAVI